MEQREQIDAVLLRLDEIHASLIQFVEVGVRMQAMTGSAYLPASVSKCRTGLDACNDARVILLGLSGGV